MKATALYSAEPAKGWMVWGALAPILCIVLVALPDLAVSFALMPFHMVDEHGDPRGPLSFLVFLLATFPLMGAVFLGWVRFVERRPLATIGLAGPHRARTFLTGLALGVATSAAVVAMIGIGGGYRVGGIGGAFASPRALLYIVALLGGFAVQSSVEETVFRGWLLSGIARKFNVTVAVLLVSATFTLLHFEPRQHWATTATSFLFSVFACVWALRAGNIRGVMGWHAGWNWLLAVGFEVPVTGLKTDLPALLVKLTPVGSRLLTGGGQGPEGSLSCNLFLAGAVAFLLALRGRIRAAAPAEAVA